MPENYRDGNSGSTNFACRALKTEKYMLDIYKASAGAGKTFALTLEYFRTIFASPTEYKNILAVTFTNKATEEMKSRIINELHRLADGKQVITERP